MLRATSYNLNGWYQKVSDLNECPLYSLPEYELQISLVYAGNQFKGTCQLRAKI